MIEKIKKYNFLFFVIALYLLIISYMSYSFVFTHNDNKKGEAIAIDSSLEINQVLDLKSQPITKIDILLGRDEKYNSGSIIIYLLENEKMIEKWEKNASDIRNNEYSSFSLSQPLLMDSKKNYKIIIEKKMRIATEYFHIKTQK